LSPAIHSGPALSVKPTNRSGTVIHERGGSQVQVNLGVKDRREDSSRNM
jgi:hypothetical protein